VKVLLVALGAVVLSGCAQLKPWERDVLAKKEMALDPDGLRSALQQHIYFSKEASSGGYGTGGGGCGCN
jgi:hypothetical protein